MSLPRRLATAALSLVCLGMACGNFTATNPYDPRYALKVTISGPDSTTSLWEVVKFDVSTTPAWTGSPPMWGSSNPLRLNPIGNGTFQVIYATDAPTTITVGVAVGPHRASRTITLRQRAVSLLFHDADNFVVDSLVFGSAPSSLTCLPVAYDGGGSPIALTPDRWQLVSRDTQVATVANFLAQRVGSGRTWIVAIGDGVTDSIPVIAP